MKRGNYRGRIYNAKPIFLLFILDQIDRRIIKDNRIYFSSLTYDKTYALFTHQYTDKPTPLQYPFFHLQNEAFWHLVWKENEMKSDTPSAKFIRDNVDYSYLDNALWDLLQESENRRYFRDAIVNYFFKDDEESTTTEKGYRSNMEEATPRQLWALKRATGIDYRGRGLTKQEASEMIAESMKKAEEQGVAPSSTEATPRQLRYLERATGIDYSSNGLTKAEATKMIRELKETEANDADEINPEAATDRQLRYLKKATGIDYTNQKLTKQQASKLIQECKMGEEGEIQNKIQARMQPAPEPGTLEYVLSKCKTREEQLEAARKFFGEDK